MSFRANCYAFETVQCLINYTGMEGISRGSIGTSVGQRIAAVVNVVFIFEALNLVIIKKYVASKI